jgi:hypothetical protein
MKNSANQKSCKGVSKFTAAILAVGITLAPVVDANAGSEKPDGKPTDVVAHVELSGGPATRMLLVKKGSKRFLLVWLSSSAGVAVLDVTDSSRPRALDATVGASGTPVNEIEILAVTLSVFGKSEAESTVTVSAEPAEIQRFPGVTTFVTDKARRLIYAANTEGLWIVKTKQKQKFDDFQDSVPDLNSGGG